MWILPAGSSFHHYDHRVRSAIPILVLAPWIVLSDLRTHRIPNSSLIALLFLIEANSLNPYRPFPASAYLLALAILLLGLLFNVCIGQAIGMGDIKLFSLCSLPLGSMQSSLTALLLACAIALPAAILMKRKVIAFGPALLIGVFSVLMSR